MKLTTQTAVVLCTALVGLVALVIGLAVFAKMSDGAIIGLIGGIGAAIVNLVVLARGQQTTTETLRSQDEKLDQITKQTNGLSEIERQEIADRAAVAVVAAYREGKLR